MFCFLTTGIPSLSLTCSYMVTNGMSAMKCTEDDLLTRYYWNIVITPCFGWISISYYFLKTSDHFRNKILLPVHNLTYMSVCMFMFIKNCVLQYPRVMSYSKLWKKVKLLAEISSEAAQGFKDCWCLSSEVPTWLSKRLPVKNSLGNPRFLILWIQQKASHWYDGLFYNNVLSFLFRMHPYCIKH